MLSGIVWVEITDTGTLDLSTNRFTTANNLVTGLNYQFMICAINGVGTSPCSFVESSTKFVAALVPGAPSSLTKLSAS
jgi:hypothetical protein